MNVAPMPFQKYNSRLGQRCRTEEDVASTKRLLTFIVVLRLIAGIDFHLLHKWFSFVRRTCGSKFSWSIKPPIQLHIAANDQREIALFGSILRMNIWISSNIHIPSNLAVAMACPMLATLSAHTQLFELWRTHIATIVACARIIIIINELVRSLLLCPGLIAFRCG